MVYFALIIVFYTFSILSMEDREMEYQVQCNYGECSTQLSSNLKVTLKGNYLSHYSRKHLIVDIPAITSGANNLYFLSCSECEKKFSNCDEGVLKDVYRKHNLSFHQAELKAKLVENFEKTVLSVKKKKSVNSSLLAQFYVRCIMCTIRISSYDKSDVIDSYFDHLKSKHQCESPQRKAIEMAIYQERVSL